MTEIEIASKISEIDQRNKSNTHRLDKVEERQDNLDALVATVATMANEQEHIKEDVTEIKTDVKTMMDKSGKLWDGLVEKVIYILVAALMGFLLAQVGVA